MRIFSTISCLLMSLALFSGQANAQKKKEEFQITIYGPPPAKLQNDEQYQRLKDAHVDIIISGGGSKAGNLKTLDIAGKYGMKVYVSDGRLSQGDDKIKEVVNDFKNHPALGGYYITDEPDSARLQSAVELMLKVKRLDPAKDAYINHLPDFAVNNYEHGFLKRYIETAGKENINYLAYDNYPYKRGHRLEKTYFNNLDIIRRTGLKYDIKTSSCLQSFGMAYGEVIELRRPNAHEIRMNVYSNLAYGIKNAVWYLYYTRDNLPVPKTVPTMLKSVIDSAGVKTDMYEPFQQMNSEMKQLGKTLINLDAQEVYHTGDSLWIGTALPPSNFIAQVEDKKAEVILSRFTDKTSGKQYLMVVNRSFKKPATLTVLLDNSVKKISEISKSTGKSVKANFDVKKHKITDQFLPGEGRLYAIN
jgi:hypothetical protein